MDPAEFWEELATIKVGNNGFLDCLNFINLCMYFFVNSYYFINNFGLIFGYFSFMVYVVMWTDLCKPMQLCEVLWSENALLGRLESFEVHPAYFYWYKLLHWLPSQELFCCHQTYQYFEFLYAQSRPIYSTLSCYHTKLLLISSAAIKPVCALINFSLASSSCAFVLFIITSDCLFLSVSRQANSIPDVAYNCLLTSFLKPPYSYLT